MSSGWSPRPTPGVGGFEFVPLDDYAYVPDNPLVNRGLSAEALGRALTSFAHGFWIPLTWLSFMADVSLFGVSPGAMHLVNAALHGANALLLLSVLRRATGSLWRSAAAAALFAAHPLRVESVAWITERKDLLSTLFFLLCLAAWLRHCRRRSPRALAAASAALAASLMSKPMLLTLPILLLVLDFWPLGRWGPAWSSLPGRPALPPRAILPEKLPFLLVAIGFAAVLLASQQSAGQLRSLGDFALADRLGRAAASYAVYLGRSLWPFGLRVGPPVAPGEVPALPAAFAALGLAALSAWAWSGRRHRPAIAAGWLWYVITLLPVCGLVPSGLQGFENRFTYVPSIGLGVMLVWGVADLLGRLPSRGRLAPALAVAAALALAALSWRQAGSWRDGTTLFGEAVRLSPGDLWAQPARGVLAPPRRVRARDRGIPHRGRPRPGGRDRPLVARRGAWRLRPHGGGAGLARASPGDRAGEPRRELQPRRGPDGAGPSPGGGAALPPRPRGAARGRAGPLQSRAASPGPGAGRAGPGAARGDSPAGARDDGGARAARAPGEGPALRRRPRTPGE